MLVVALLLSCGRGSPGLSDGGLHWWTTCGDPLCAGHRDAGLPACTGSESAGASCAVAGAKCDPGDNCNVELVCAASDPKQGTCPVSRGRAKKDIRYLSAADLKTYRDQLLHLPLATYRYREEPEDSRLRLGFLIDGHESLICVDPARDQVDLYGYASMAVAALQAQNMEIEKLHEEVRELRAALSHGQSDGASPPEPKVERGPKVSASRSSTSPPLREIPPAERKPGLRVIPVKPLPRKQPPPDAGPPDDSPR